ncbi:MAG: enoyl-CoA hydratase/isomerase family protein [Pseudomonadota bacterium]
MNKPADPAPDAGQTRLEIAGHVAQIWFDRPRARNAMTWDMYEGLAESCAAIAARDDVRVVVLRGAGGKAFIAGTDIEQFMTFESGDDGVRYEAAIARYVGAVASLEIPTIAVVEGWAVGGGMAIASVCDFRIATPGARFGVPIARTLGNCLSTGNLAVLMAQLGPSIVRRMLLLAEMVPAEELLANGYVLEIAPSEALDDVVAARAATLASHAPVTMAVTKTALARLIEAGVVDDHDLVTRAYGSDDFHAGVRAFVARGRPDWQGR